MGKLFLLFTLVPLFELYLLMQLADVMGFFTTVALVVLTGVIGAALAKAEGLRVVRSWQTALAQGRVPEEGVIGGLLVLIGGVLLITPGVMTDVLGFCLLIPATRQFLSDAISKHIQRGIERGTIHVVQGPGTHPFGDGPHPFGKRPGPFDSAGRPHPTAPQSGRRQIDREVIEVEAKVLETRDPEA